MQLPTMLGRRHQPSRLPSIPQLFFSKWLRFATLVWVSGAIALTVPLPGTSVNHRAQPQFLPPLASNDAGMVAESASLTKQLQPVVPFLSSQEGQAGMAVIDSRHHVVLEADSHQPFVLASVAKLYILTAYLNLVASENRDLTPDEHDILADMIEASDNDSATTLWDRIGKTEGLQHYLASRQLPPIEPATDDDSWGDMRADATSVGALLTGLYEGRLLGPELTAEALHLLSHVIDSQSWGVGVAAQSDDQTPPNDAPPQVYLKNGWYPEDNGWVVNTAGVIAHGAEHYVVVVLSDGQPSFRAGVELVETAAAFVADRLP
jgi:hypothetical protein